MGSFSARPDGRGRLLSAAPSRGKAADKLPAALLPPPSGQDASASAGISNSSAALISVQSITIVKVGTCT